MIETKYLLDYTTYIKDRPDEVRDAWAEQYKTLMETKDTSVFTFIIQYIFM